MGFAALQDLVAHRAVQHLAHVLDRAEQEGHGRHLRQRADVVHRADVHAREVQRADLDLVDGLLLAAQRPLLKTLILCLPPLAFFQQFAHVLDGHHGG
jgi:hypothetical protein